MKANGRARTLRLDDGGVSNVVGAVLTVGLLAATIVTVRVNWVPIWEEDKEASHAQVVLRQLLQIKSDIDRLGDNRSLVPVKNPLSLGPESRSIWTGGAGGGGEVLFQPAGRSVGLDAQRIRIQVENGTSFVGGVAESWEVIETGGIVDNISNVASFRLRIDEVNADHAGDSLTFTIRDAQGALVGECRVTVENPPGPDYYLNVNVTTAAGVELYDQPESVFQGATLSPYWIDLLDPKYRFVHLLQSADSPFTIGLAKDGLTGDVAITYYQESADGTTVLVGAGGIDLTDYAAAYHGGYLRTISHSAHYVRQELHLEHGAIIVKQADGFAFKSEPGFRAGVVGNRTSVTFTVPVLTGQEASLSGTNTAILEARAQRHVGLEAQTPGFTLSIGTDFPTLWRDLWQRDLGAVGFTQGVEYDIAITSTSANLSVWGHESDPASTYHDVSLNLQQATIQLNLEG